MKYNTACICEYLGTNYSGWQRQKNGKAIQEVIENLLNNIFREEIKIAGSGRTDAGVHALGQVFSFKSSTYREPNIITRALNGLLPRDIAIIDTKSVPLTFHAGKSVLSKTYLYKILNRPYPSALYYNRALWVRNEINLDLLNETLSLLHGRHDFASFCVSKTKKQNTNRTIFFAKAYRENDFINIEINASGFLHNMVRIITGTCLNIVTKGGKPEDIIDILNAKDRKKAGTTAVASGLYQKEVFYNLNNISGLAGIDLA